ncbi:hypothetical protein [Nostoc sp. FACHB-110]|uniref:hypothetical protein n=1 Tax=Nostoc sp. FACHB-110 TaxID=2692834 RepID=UPI001F54B7AE|nr:hypothetical protein [Nostoc sp. FACHB-110]
MAFSPLPPAPFPLAGSQSVKSAAMVSQLVGFDGEPLMQWVMNFCRWIVRVVLRSQEAKGFVLLKKRLRKPGFRLLKNGCKDSDGFNS